MIEYTITEDILKPYKIDKGEFNNLFRELYPNLKAYGCLFVDEESSEDIVQDVFIYLWENRETLIIHSSIKAYLFKAVYTRCLNNINRKKMVNTNKQHLEIEQRNYETSFYDPDKNEVIRKLYMNDLSDEINHAIETLPLKCREVFTLSYIEDMKNKEISNQLDISISTVEKHINHALKVLRPLLQNKQIISILTFFS